MALTSGGRPTPQVDRSSRTGLRRNSENTPRFRRPGPRRHGSGRGARLGLLVATALLLPLGLVAPVPAGAAGTAASASPSPASSAGAVDARPVPVTGMTANTDTAGQSSLTVVLFDGDIVLVGGRGFSPGREVAVTAATAELGGSATAQPGTDGRFILGFQVPAGFSGRVTVTARQDALEVSGTLDVVDAELTAPAAETPGTATAESPTAEPAATPAPSTGAAPSPSARTGSTPATPGKLSGLPWMSGVYPSHILAQVLSFGNWRGRANDVAHVFTVRSKGWSAMVEPRWPLDLYKGFQGTLIISQPTFPKGQGNNAACARGEYDKYWKTFGTFLKNNGRAASIVRIGWEFNGTFMYWHADNAGTEFRDCFRKISTAIRSTDPEVKIDWTFNAHASPVPKTGTPWAAYPGDEYVDYVGIDSYDWFPASRTEAEWNKQCNTPNGLCYLINFAREHGKKVGVGEWGVASCSRGGGGDNPFYIQKMYDTFKANADVMAYEAYFHDAAPGNVCSTIQNGGQNPKAGALYRKLFGSA
ncbi:beta-mannanase [Frankia sp. CcI49]|nr:MULTISPECIES: glycosyl hydrolase [unclassified Frankia]KPM57287.1 beta-mannanase [Frankia sp. R43]ONH50183.1 beta-mannanase [Frankia sp. CcI49]